MSAIPLTSYGLLLAALDPVAVAAGQVGKLEPKNALGKRIAPTHYLPSFAEMRADLDNGLPVRRRIADYLQEVAGHWQQLKQRPGLVAQIDAIADVPAAAINEAIRVPNGLVPRFGQFAFRIRLDQKVRGSNRLISLRDIADAVPGESDALFVEVSGTTFATLAFANALRAFDDTCIRYLAAASAAEASGVPLSRILAIYRQEGNLCVFPSVASTALRIPSGTLTVPDRDWTAATVRNADAQVENMQLNELVKANTQHWTWLADAQSSSVIGDANLPGTHDDHVRLLALGSYFVARAIGGDRLASPSFTHHLNMFAWGDEFVRRSSRIRGVARPEPGVDTMAKARERLDRLRANLEPQPMNPLSGTGPPSVVVLPIDPVALLTGLLVEGAMLVRYYEQASTLLYEDNSPRLTSESAILPVGIAYMRYNLQHSDMTERGLILAALLRMLAYPRRQAVPTVAIELYDAVMGAPDLVALLVDLAPKIDEETQVGQEQQRQERARALRFGFKMPRQENPRTQAQARHASFSEPGNPDLVNPDRIRFQRPLQAWLTDAGNRQALWDFLQAIGTQGAQGWAGYAQSRQNLTSHRRLDLYYGLVFP